ncbi:MAG TPA: beta-1,3-glucanase family protein [Verrucomicrobiae bacterium]|nr:beta-1,3-glucanase family protein [Verrucomicrobiae bacterium]
MTDRKAFIASLASTAALAACAGNPSMPGASTSLPARGLGKRRSAAELLALSLSNKSGAYQDKDVYFLLYGQGIPPDNDWYHLTDPATGAIERCASTGLKYTADYSFQLSDVSKLMLPPMRAARLYFSFAKKLLLQVNDAGIPSPPIGFDSTAQNVNYETVFDFVEWTLWYPSDAGWNGNLTLVQSVNIPIDFHIAGESLTGTKLDYTRGWLEGGYTKFLNSMKSQPDFADLVLPGLNRVLAPDVGLEPFAGKNGPVFKADYYDGYIDDVWTKYSTDKMVVVTNQGATWNGSIQSDKLVFSPVTGQTNLEPISLRKPTTKEVFACSDICVSGCKSSTPQQEDVNNQIRGAFLSAMNRSTLLTDTTIGVDPVSAYCKDTSAFYQGKQTNFYAKYIHENTQEHLAYAFGIDDYCLQSSFVTVQKPNVFEIVLVKQ